MHSPTVRKIDTAIEKMEEELNKLKAEREKLASMPLNKRLAVEMHSHYCNGNHDDGCGWFYEFKDGEHKWDHTTYAHSRFLNSANVILGKLTQYGIGEDMAIPLLELFAKNRG